MNLRNAILVVVSGAVASVLGSVAHAASYYISATTGNDSNSGLTPAAAWQSLGKINSTAFAAGDRVYLKAGDSWNASGAASYSLDWSGTSANHVIVGAYHTDSSGNPVSGPGTAARPIVASTHVFTALSSTHTSNSPYDYTPAFHITGSYVELRDLEIDNFGEALKIEGTSHVTVDNVKSSASYECGMATVGVDTVTISNSEVVGDNQGWGHYNEPRNSWCSAVNLQYTTNFTVHGNFIHEGFGEGILPFRASKVGDISNNTVFAQRAVGIYTGWAQNLNIHANLVLGTSNSTYWRSGSFTGPGIAMENEDIELTSGKVSESDMLENIAVYDNLVAGTSQGFAIWHSNSPPSNGGAVVNVSVYNNTFVDNGTQIAPSKCNGCIAENNIFLSLTSGALDQGGGGGSGGVVFHNNYWSEGNPGTGLADAATDVYSGLTLTKMTGWRSIANVSSLPTWQSFSPLSGSSTFQEGTALLAAPYNVDFNGSPHRNPMDLGGLAGSGGVIAPVAAFSCTPLTGTAPVAVVCTDASTNSPTAWSWTFGDGGTSASRNPSHSYSAAGTYTIALTASNSGGSNTLTRTGYVTVSGSSGSVTPNPASAGQTITISDTFTATVTDSTADIVYWVKNTAGNVLARCGSTSTSITSGQPKTLTCTVALPTTAASGSYTVSGTVYQSASNQTGIQSIPTFANLTVQ